MIATRHRPPPESGTPIHLNQVDPLKAARDSQAYMSGFQVGCTGSIGLNPFTQPSDDHKYWILGWCAGFTHEGSE